MTAYAITLCWDNCYVVAPVEADCIESAIDAAYEWAGNGGYEEQDTYDEGGETYVGHITQCDDLADAEQRGSYSYSAAGPDGLPIPIEHQSDGHKLVAVRAALAELVEWAARMGGYQSECCAMPATRSCSPAKPRT